MTSSDQAQPGEVLSGQGCHLGDPMLLRSFLRHARGRRSRPDRAQPAPWNRSVRPRRHRSGSCERHESAIMEITPRGGSVTDTADTESGELSASFMDPAVQDDPFDVYAEMHEKCPVHRLPENGLYMVTKYDDVRTCSPIRRRSRAAQWGSGRHERSRPGPRRGLRDKRLGRAQTLQRTDPPEHTHYRKLLGRVFTNRRVQDMVPRIDEITHELIDRFIDRGECEFISEFALPLPGSSSASSWAAGRRVRDVQEVGRCHVGDVAPAARARRRPLNRQSSKSRPSITWSGVRGQARRPDRRSDLGARARARKTTSRSTRKSCWT